MCTYVVGSWGFEVAFGSVLSLILFASSELYLGLKFIDRGYVLGNLDVSMSFILASSL